MEKYISDDTLCYLAFKLYLKTTVLDLVKKKKTFEQKRGLQLEQNSHLHIVFCLSQNWKLKFFEKRNLNRIYRTLMIFFPLEARRRKHKVTYR